MDALFSPDKTMEIYIQVYDPSLGTMEDDAWVEITFEVPLSFEPNDPSVGYTGGWFVDGNITDSDGYKFSDSDIDEMCIFSDSDSTGFDWDNLFNEAAQEVADDIAEAKIAAYEARMGYDY